MVVLDWMVLTMVLFLLPSLPMDHILSLSLPWFCGCGVDAFSLVIGSSLPSKALAVGLIALASSPSF